MLLFCVVGRSGGCARQMYLCARRYPEGSHDTSSQSGNHEARQVLRNRYVRCGEAQYGVGRFSTVWEVQYVMRMSVKNCRGSCASGTNSQSLYFNKING